MLRTKFKNQQIENAKTKIYTFQNFQFHFHYQVMAKNVLIKTKSNTMLLSDGLMIKLSVYQAVPTACTGSNPVWANFFFFSKLFFTAS